MSEAATRDMCSKIIQHSATDIGKTYKSQCIKPEYKEGLCKYHYERKEEKAKNWGNRIGYRDATQSDLDNKRSLKLKSSHAHELYKCISGTIRKYSSRTDSYDIDTDIPHDFNLFCVKE